MEFSTVALSLRKNCHGLQNSPYVLKPSLKWIANIYLKTFNLGLAHNFQTSQFARLISSTWCRHQLSRKDDDIFFVATKLCCYVHQIFVLKLKTCLIVLYETPRIQFKHADQAPTNPMTE